MQTTKKKLPTPPAPRVVASQPAQQFWDMFKDCTEPDYSAKEPFRLLVVVDGMSGPMHSRYDYIRDLGAPHIMSVLRGEGSLPDGDLTFILPDRWLTPGQGQQFVYNLRRHPDIVNKPRRSVLIVTYQPYIVGDCRREQVRVIREERLESLPAGLLQDSLSFGVF